MFVCAHGVMQCSQHTCMVSTRVTYMPGAPSSPRTAPAWPRLLHLFISLSLSSTGMRICRAPPPCPPSPPRPPSPFLLINHKCNPPSPTQVIMATNRADTLDPALLRPGRLDRKIEFPVPDRRQKRLIFQVGTWWGE